MLKKKILKKKGKILSPSNRTGQDLYVGLEWLTELEHDRRAFAPLLAIQKIKSPCCIIHGQNDPTVPVQCADELFDAAGQGANAAIIPDADHVFKSPNPLPLDATPPIITQQFFDSVLQFISKTLEKQSVTDV